MKNSSSRTGLWLTIPIAALLALAAGSGLIIDGLYRDVPSLVAQAKGQDIVSLGIVLPVLLITAALAWHGSLRARLVWLGALAYLVYTYASFAFAIQYNPLFITYIALLGCSLYALIGNLAAIDMAEVKARFTGKSPIRAASTYLAVLVIVFYGLWLSELIPALLEGKVPQSILVDGTPTNAIHVLDMAWILPAFAATSISLWHKHPLGYTLAGVALSYFVLMALAILSMGLFEALAGSPGAIPMISLFGTLIAVAAGILAQYLKCLRSQAGMGEEETPIMLGQVKGRV